MKSLSRVRLCATPWTAAHQAPPSMGFSRQEYWSGVPLPSPICDLGTIYSCRFANCASASPRLRVLGVSREEGHADCTAGFALQSAVLTSVLYMMLLRKSKLKEEPLFSKKKKKANRQPNIFKPSYISLFCLDCFSERFSLGTTCSL